MTSTLEAIRADMVDLGCSRLWADDAIKIVENAPNSIQLTLCYKVKGYNQRQIAKQLHLGTTSINRYVHALRHALYSLRDATYA